MATPTAAAAAVKAPPAASELIIRPASLTFTPATLSSIGNPRNTATSTATDQTTTLTVPAERIDTSATVVGAPAAYLHRTHHVHPRLGAHRDPSSDHN